MSRRRIISVLAVVALVAVACHNAWLSSGGVYWYDELECLDRTSQIKIKNGPAPPSESGIYASTGYFHADANGCHFTGQLGGRLEVTGELHKANVGLCGPTYPWNVNAYGSGAAEFLRDPLYFCGTANYVTISHHHGFVSVNACCDWVNTSAYSPADHYEAFTA